MIGREGYVTLSGFWQLMQRVQQYTIALRECCVRIDVTPDQDNSRINDICYRVVTPDFVYAEAHPDQPDEMVYYQEYRLRFNSNKDEYSSGIFLGSCCPTINESSTLEAELSDVDISPLNESIDDTVENLSCSGHRTYLSSYSTETERSHETNNTETLSQSLGGEDSSSPTELNKNRSLVREEVVLSKNATASSLDDLNNTNQGSL